MGMNSLLSSLRKIVVFERNITTTTATKTAVCIDVDFSLSFFFTRFIKNTQQQQQSVFSFRIVNYFIELSTKTHVCLFIKFIKKVFKLFNC